MQAIGELHGDKKTLPAFGAHRGGCEVSTSAGSVAVGLIKAALAGEIARTFDNATDMPANQFLGNRFARVSESMDFSQTA